MSERFHIVYAEDNLADADLLRVEFARSAPEFDVTVVESGQACLAALADRPCAVLLLDHRLPDMHGQDVLRLLMKRGDSCPVVLITGKGDEELVLRALRMGAVDYVPKVGEYLRDLPDRLREIIATHREKNSGDFQIRAKHILYIEHSSMDIELTQLHFEEHAPHLILDIAQSCDEARRKILSDSHYDLVLLDLQMPNQNGLDFVRDIHCEQASLPPFIVISGRGDDVSAITALRLGAIDYIAKQSGYLFKVTSTIDHAIAREQLRRANLQLRGELASRKQNERLLQGQKEVLELIASDATLEVSLNHLLSVIEAQAPEAICSILLLENDGLRLRHGAAPRLPAAYIQAIDGVSIGPNVGSCGTAAFRKESVAVADIANDPLWADFKEMALAHGLRACWSTPILDAKHNIIGTFAIYFRKVGLPTDKHKQLIDIATQTAAIAIAHEKTHQALRESESRHRGLYESNIIGVIIARTDGSITEVNDHFLQMIGYSRAEVRENVLRWDRLTPEKWKATDQHIAAELRREGSCRAVEKEYWHKNGTAVPIRASVVLLNEATEECLCLIEDLTKEKAALASLKESEERYRDLVEHSNDLICTHDLDGKLLSVNEASVRLTGYSAAQLLTMNLCDLLAPDMRAAFPKYLARLVERGHAAGVMKISTANGTIRYWEFSNSLRREGVAKPLVRGMAHDITERKKGEWALRESEVRLRAIFEQAPLGIAEGHIASADYVQINQRYADIVGYPIEELKKMTFRDITHPEDLDKDLDLFLQLSQGKMRFYTIEKRYLRKDRAVVWVNITVSAIAREGGGKPQYCMAVIEDITEKKRLEAQLRQSQKMEAIGQLSGGIAHDFNNILTVIKGRVSLLQSTPDFTAEVTESVGEIADAANRAAALTRQLLAFSRRQVMQQQDLDLHELVRGMSVLLRRLLGEQISVGLEFSDTPIWAHADRALLEQVLLNLAINARDAMPQGGQLEISIASRDVTADEAARWTQATAGRFAVLSVRDTGTGIAADVLPHIFEPFFTTKDVGEGTGLGLATVYGIVQQHRGGIEVESTIGFGTVFHVFLPLVEAPMPTEKPTEAKARPVSGTETILLVEDELAVQQIAQLVLQRLGYRVLTADDGRAALDVWREHRDAIHLLLTDLVMPAGISGQELAKQLIAEKPALRIIYTSGYSASIAGKDFQLDGKANFLGKPYDPLQLSAMVRKTLDAKPNKPPFV